jgi:RNA polymerase sigma factor FliA
MEVPRPYGMELTEAKPADNSTFEPSVEVPQLTVNSEATEPELWCRWRASGDLLARAALIQLHSQYARALAAKLYKSHDYHETTFEEYVQCANLGMIESIDRFDPARGAQFRTYAYTRILGAIRDGLEHISERQEQISLRSRLLRERVQSLKEGIDLNNEKELLENMATISVGIALSFILEGTGLIESSENSCPENGYASIELRELRQQLLTVLDTLTEREQAVVRLHYLQGFTVDQIAATLEITKGRVSQLHKQAILRLRAELSTLKNLNLTG